MPNPPEEPENKGAFSHEYRIYSTGVFQPATSFSKPQVGDTLNLLVVAAMNQEGKEDFIEKNKGVNVEKAKIAYEKNLLAAFDKIHGDKSPVDDKLTRAELTAHLSKLVPGTKADRSDELTRDEFANRARFFASRLNDADRDENGYLDASEIGLVPNKIALDKMDTNHDNHTSLSELRQSKDVMVASSISWLSAVPEAPLKGVAKPFAENEKENER